jgi:hypothetical protein
LRTIVALSALKEEEEEWEAEDVRGTGEGAEKDGGAEACAPPPNMDMTPDHHPPPPPPPPPTTAGAARAAAANVGGGTYEGGSEGRYTEGGGGAGVVYAAACGLALSCRMSASVLLSPPILPDRGTSEISSSISKSSIFDSICVFCGS